MTDDALDAEMTLHQIADDLYLLVLGRTDERDGSIEPFPMYETVSITAIRGGPGCRAQCLERASG